MPFDPGQQIVHQNDFSVNLRVDFHISVNENQRSFTFRCHSNPNRDTFKEEPDDVSGALPSLFDNNCL